jgi:glycosyltransferase involved in cell wall biosynthesis
LAQLRNRSFAGLATGLRSWPANPKRLRQEGDAARDAKNWDAAATAYGAYLKLHADDAPIWVQYGHALKEKGLNAESERAYRRAMTLMPADPDVQLHLAHLLKQLDRPDDAKQIFSELLEISPSLEILQEIRGLGGAGQAPVNLQQRPTLAVPGGVYIELKDLFVYLSLHTTVTGITRVTLGLVNYILQDMESGKAAHYNFVHQFRDGEGLLLISKDNMRRMVQAAMTGKPDIDKMQELIKLIHATSVLFQLDRGDTYLIPGAFWEFVANPSWIGGMRQRGVRIGAYIYDLIPITHHQYCMHELTEAFTIAFAETARLLDFALTISAFVAKDVTDYLEAHEIAPLVAVPVPLAHELRFDLEAARTDAKVEAGAKDQAVAKAKPPSEARSYLTNVSYVLCVCTIEARKNHAYLFAIWQRMIQAGLVVPDLVFVGRPGWRVGDLIEEIEESRYLGGRLHILNGLTDDELGDLYDRCLFTVFPSFVEGWGLPVGESLAHGKVCVASSSSSIPEVGGEHVIYVDPHDVDEGYDTISELVREPALLAQREQTLRNSFVPRTWKSVGGDFFGKLDAILGDIDSGVSKRAVFAPFLRGGEFFDVASLSRVGKRGAAYVRNPTRLLFADGWRGIEATGTWMLNREATVKVQTSYAPRTKVSVLLHLGTSPWVGAHNTLTVTAGGEAASLAPYRRPLSPDRDLWLTLPGITDDNGQLAVWIEATGSVLTKQVSDIPVTIRFRGMAYAPLEDTQARLDLLARVLLSPGSL